MQPRTPLWEVISVDLMVPTTVIVKYRMVVCSLSSCQCDKVVSPNKNISCAECKSCFHPQCTKLAFISNYNRVWKCDSCLRSQNLTIRKKTDKSDTNIETETITDLSSVPSSFKTILAKLENLDKLIISFMDCKNL